MAVKRIFEPKNYDNKLSFKIPKCSLFKTISFSTIILVLIMYLHTLFSYLSSSHLSKSSNPNKPQIVQQILSTNTSEKPEFFDIDDPFIPPENSSREGRVLWFRDKLPNLEILNPKDTSKTLIFHERVTQFLTRNCSVRFYMTWLTSLSSFGNRQLLTIDSLFKANPKSCLVIVSQSLDTLKGHKTLEPFIELGSRILALTPDLSFLVENTPAERWLREMKSGTRDPGSIPLSQNLSNLIRLLMLYKYGGVYLDADVLILRDFSGIRNCVGAQSINPVTREWTRLNGAVMVFDVKHPLLREFIEEFAESFDGNRWGYNGPYLITRVVERFPSNRVYDYRFEVLPTRAFYPVNWLRINRVMRKPENETEERWDDKILRELNGKETYAMHLWYKKSQEYGIEQGSVVARLILDHCLVCYNVFS